MLQIIYLSNIDFHYLIIFENKFLNVAKNYYLFFLFTF